MTIKQNPLPQDIMSKDPANQQQYQQDNLNYSTEDLHLEYDNCEFQELEHQKDPFIDSRASVDSDRLRQIQPKKVTLAKSKASKKAAVPATPSEALPRYSEIQRSLQILKIIVPDLFPDEFVDQIFSLSSRRLAEGTLPTGLANPKKRNYKPRTMKKQQKQKESKAAKEPKQPKQAKEGKERKEGKESVYRQQPTFSKALQPTFSNALQPTFSNALQPPQQYQFQDYLIGQEVQLKYEQLSHLDQYSENEVNPIDNNRVIAKVFCEFGNNEELLTQAVREIATRLNKNVCDHKPVLDSIVLNAFAKLQSFLILECHQRVASLIIEFGKKSLNAVLLECSKKFPLQQCQPFLNIIRGQYGLMNVNITEEEVRGFYELVRKALNEAAATAPQDDPKKHSRYAIPQEEQKSRFTHVIRKRNRVKGQSLQKGVRQLDEVRRLNRVWNHRYEMQLIRSYRNYKTIADIKSHFCQMFPQDGDCFSTVALRSKLYTILRHAIRKLCTFIGDNPTNLPAFDKIGHNEIRWIIYNNEGAHIRLLLLSVYTATQYDQALIRKTIVCIVDYTEEIHKNLKLNQMIEDCNTHKRMTEKLKANSHLKSIKY